MRHSVVPMHLGVVVHFVNVDRQAISHPRRHSQCRVQRRCRYHNGVPSIRLRVSHAPEQLPVQSVNVQARRRGPPLSLGVKPLISAHGIDIDEVDLSSNCPVIPLKPGNIGVNHSLFITAHPTVWNVTIIAVADTALIARALVEEHVLAKDRSYRAYCSRVAWHLVPGLF